jgi:hypothetical protein
VERIQEKQGEFRPYRKPRRLDTDFPQQWLGIDPRSDDVGFMVDKVTLEQVYSEYFGFPYHF